MKDTGTDWKSISNTVEKIGDEAERIGWDELNDMVADAYTQASAEPSAANKLFDWYQFFYRLYHRVKDMDSPEPFNRVTKTQRLIDHDWRPMYMVDNYDYKTFIWARKNGHTDYITNKWLLVREDELTDKMKASFEKKCENTF